ncbi:hypothetical protein [Castellaniella sp.]|uniref:hypothetical protein n=1 Tax=Castellaniella sp. TaxID=1955812 RepID=UPI002AFE7E94|nr:hypothetical protein [Castellaniella sp.]
MSPDTALTTRKTRFSLGKIRITAAAILALEATATEGVFLLHRHLHRDWGDLSAQDILQNEIALLLDMRVLSRYALAKNTEIWIITDADRRTTTIMVPDADLAQYPR